MQNLPPATATIHATHDLTIEHNDRVWRLVNGAARPDTPDQRTSLVDADATHILCAPAFAQARKLPHAALSPDDIARVVVGWAPEHHRWHLGLLLAAQPDTDYKTRWCGLASWPSGAPDAHLADAQTAGQALARVINRPFHLIPAKAAPVPEKDDTQPIQGTRPIQSPQAAQVMPPETAPVAVSQPEPVARQQPPFTINTWTMHATRRGYVLRRRGKWVLGALGKALGFVALVVLYLVLGVGTLTSSLASVNPGWLPALGLAVAIVLVLLALRQLWLVLNVTDMIIDTNRREVCARQRFTGRTRWRLPFDRVAYVLVSQTPARAQNTKRADETTIVQDIWLHLSDGTRFYQLAAIDEVEGVSRQWESTRQRQKTAGRRRLRLSRYDSPAHQAARFIADALKTDLWLDIR